MNTKKLNKAVLGTGFQFFATKTKVRIENEDGDFLRYSRNIVAAIKRHIPNGCGRRSLQSLLRMVSV